MIIFLIILMLSFNKTAESSTISKVYFQRVSIQTTSVGGGEEPPPETGNLQFLGDDLAFNGDSLSFNP